MKDRFNKISVTLLLCVLLLSGCNSDSSQQQVEDLEQQEYRTQIQDNRQEGIPDTEAGEENESGNQAENADKNKVNESESSKAEVTQLEPPVTVEVPIYTINTETMDTKATVASVSEDAEITAELLVQLVISDIADKSYVIEVNEVLMEDSYAVVDFSSSTPPVVNVGAETEGTILDAIAFSLLDNLSECKGIIFREDGQAYVSENFSFEKNEIYLSR